MSQSLLIISQVWSNARDAVISSLRDGELFEIVNDKSGKVIAYAIGEDQAIRIRDALQNHRR